MKILGVDASYTGTGWALIDNGELINHGLISTKPDKSDIERQAIITDAIFELDSPDLVAIEGYSMASKGNAILRLAELGGVLRWRLTRDEQPFVVIPPGTWKKLVCGKGNLDKTGVTLELYKRYGIDFKEQNATDAFGVAMAAHLQAA